MSFTFHLVTESDFKLPAKRQFDLFFSTQYLDEWDFVVSEIAPKIVCALRKSTLITTLHKFSTKTRVVVGKSRRTS